MILTVLSRVFVILGLVFVFVSVCFLISRVIEDSNIDSPTGFHYKVKIRETTYLANEKPIFDNGMICVKDAAKRIGDSRQYWTKHKTECASINKDIYYLEELD